MTQDEPQKDAQNENGQPCPSCLHCEALAKQCDEYKQGWQRAVADYQNLQKETARQRGEWAAMSEAHILEEFLPVYDNFKKAISHTFVTNSDRGKPIANSQELNWMKGIEFIMKQFGDVLRAHDIEEIKTVGAMFDATRHESVGEEASDAPEHTIVREVDGGYMMKGKVLKVAKVIVAKSV